MVKLLFLLLPAINKLPKTFRKINSNCNYNSNGATSIFYYCNQCNNEIEDTKQACESCGLLNKKEKLNSFYFVDFEEQIRNIIIANGDQISDFKSRKRNFFDLADSKFFVSDENTINLMMYTDGLTLDKSNKKTIWPVICNIIDVPPSLRNSNRCKIICGVWYGEEDPSCCSLLNKVCDKLKSMQTNGIRIKFGLEEWTVSINVYGFIADAPAKAMALNMLRHNGYCSCPHCTIKGKNETINRHF